MNHDPKKQFAADVKWYPVRRITFAGASQINGAGVRTDLPGDITQTNVARWTIEYGPSWRHFRVTYLAADPREEPRVQMVPEAAVRTWEPML